jgi:hypothetical protein
MYFWLVVGLNFWLKVGLRGVHWTLHIASPGRPIGTHTDRVSSFWEECMLRYYSNQSDNFHSIVSPGTHYCWVARGDVDSKACLRLSQMAGAENRIQTPRSWVLHLHGLNHSTSCSNCVSVVFLQNLYLD